MLLAFDRLGVEVQGEESKGRTDLNSFLAQWKAAKLHELIRQKRPERYVLIQHDLPDQIKPDPHAIMNIACTAYEADRFPAEWIAKLREFDQVWVPSTFNLDGLVTGGFPENKVRVVPHGICPEDFSLKCSPIRILNRSDFLFTSLCIANDRKGIGVLVEAFLSEFKPSEKVGLLVRSGADQLIMPIRKWKAIHNQPLAKVFLYKDFIHEDCLAAFYSTGDAYVVASRGEGFGLTYLEALSAGVPVIATRWGGHLDFLRDNNSYLVPISGLTKAWDKNDDKSEALLWAEVDTTELMRTMRHVYENLEEAKTKARRGRTEALASWTWDHAAQKGWSFIVSLLSNSGKAKDWEI